MEKILWQKLIYLQSFQLAILQNILYFEEYVRKVARHIFLMETLSQTVKHYFNDERNGLCCTKTDFIKVYKVDFLINLTFMDFLKSLEE